MVTQPTRSHRRKENGKPWQPQYCHGSPWMVVVHSCYCQWLSMTAAGLLKVKYILSLPQAYDIPFLWSAVEKEKSQNRLTWIPVNVLSLAFEYYGYTMIYVGWWLVVFGGNLAQHPTHIFLSQPQINTIVALSYDHHKSRHIFPQ